MEDINLWLKKLHQDIAMKRKQLDELRRKASFLCSEAVYHQLKLKLDYHDQRLIGHRTVLNLKDFYLNLTKKKLDTQQAVTQSGISKVKVSVKHVVDFTEEPELSSPPKRRKKQQEDETEDSVPKPEKGVLKLYETEGTIGDTAYAAAFVVKNSLDRGTERVVDLKDLRLGTQNIETKKMLPVSGVPLPGTIYSFTANLSYYKMLHEERLEALNHLESEVPGVEVVRHSEPAIVQLLSHGQHQVEVEWELAWDMLNWRFKYNIFVNCTEEVIARYSTSDVYPYLSRRQKLITPQEVLSFAEAFTNL